MTRRLGRRVVMALAVAALVTAAPAVTHSQPPSAPSSPPRRFALLVGVTEFTAPAMAKFNLEGPANDVALFRTLLETTFKVPTSAIATLSGLPADEASRPTRANIEREFRRLRDTVRPGDHVVVLLGGHGSQQPADPDPADEEPDGLDEIFLPSDATGWDGSIGRVTNAIADDDLKQWVGDIRNKGAAIWLVVDACHAGTMTRGADPRRRDRGISADRLIPAAALTAATRNAQRSGASRPVSSPAFELSRVAGDIAALYAANTIESTPELPMPDRNGPVHGLFTYTLARVLAQHTEPMTYRELLQRVIDRYRADGFGPTPAFEGAGLDREVLGERTAADRPRFTVTARTDAGWMLDGGSIHGLTTGSILEVFPPVEAADAGRSVGHVRVVSVQPTTAIVQPEPFGSVEAPSPAALVTGTRARAKYHDFGALRLRVALDQGAAGNRPVAVPAGVENALNSLRMLSQGLAERAAPADADWLARISRNRLLLVPARGDQTATITVGAVAATDLPERLADRLRKIARVANLSRLSSYVDPSANLTVRLLRWKPDSASGTPLLTEATEPRIESGDDLEIIVKNTGTVPLDLTVLYVDAKYGIAPLFPGADTLLDNRIDPGQERAARVGVTADPVGWESVVALGVPATLTHENFLGLAQESLRDTRAAGGPPPSPLRRLLEEALYGDASQRRGRDEDIGRFAISMASLHVVAAPKKR